MHRPTVHRPRRWPARTVTAAGIALALGLAGTAAAEPPVGSFQAAQSTTPGPIGADANLSDQDEQDGVPLTRAQELGLRLQQQILPPGQGVTRVSPRIDRGGFIAKVLEPTAVRDHPGGDRQIWTAGPTTMHTGNATRLMVLGARFDQSGRAWFQVQLPIRPNRRAGWIRADEVRLESTEVFVKVRLASRTVSVYRNGRLWSRSKAVIGAPKTPTPRGLFAVYETASQGSADGFLGPWALHLTAFSDVLDNYGGGPGRAAIHGRGPESIEEAGLGAAKSHGCVRVPNDFVRWLRLNAPAGTPVQITLR